MKIFFNHWARNMAKAACLATFFLSIPILVKYQVEQPVGIYAIIVSVILLPFFWPVRFLKHLLAPFQNFIFTSLLCGGISVYLWFAVPLWMPAIFWDLSALAYLIAVIRCEKGLEVAELAKAHKDLDSRI